MTTSFTQTREALARGVLRKFGVLASGGSDNSADMAIVYEAIDLRLKELHRRGIFWRKVDEVALGFTVGTVNSVSVTADILFPITMFVKNGSVDDPVTIIGITEYAAISDKTRTGVPEKALWKGGGEFLLYPVPTASASAGLVYEKIADDTTASTAPDIEVSMLRWMKDLVAYDIGDDFYQPEERMARFAKEAEFAERRIRALAVEHKDYSTVAVDDWDDHVGRRTTDYERF
jgi:hypothetical protein